MRNPELIFECDSCGLNFGLKLASIQKNSNDDICCPVCRGTKFGAE